MSCIARTDITGLVLAGGRGSRMGGGDKGLQTYGGQPLALHALRRLQPQVGTAALNANRNLPAYAAMGVPVWPDSVPGFPGPLAGLLAGLERCKTPWLATVPCDTPLFPFDLISRLAAALHQAGPDAEIAVAAAVEVGVLRAQPVFCLLRRELRDGLAACLHGGERKAGGWMRQHRCVEVRFYDASAFFNANTPADLQQLLSGPADPAG